MSKRTKVVLSDGKKETKQQSERRAKALKSVLNERTENTVKGWRRK